ncbi:DUF1015 domain-containing protein [Patescibacteria group bacterium]|nr:DUF1015 domain-containing protein [Patescibacteria group bacterium]MBU1728049.1 DUF1015 domain-containing protein [Patescibacteria group bacterium]
MFNKKYEDLGVLVPEILLPKKGIDFSKWAIVACDQYTSQPDYWGKVEKIVGDNPSTYRLILPEIFLEVPDKMERVNKIHSSMKKYLEQNIFETKKGAVYLEREVAGKIRPGLMVALDLEKYDFNVGSQTLIRATEGTILSRIPPRVEIRDGAPLESPHIMILIDDPEKTVIEPLKIYKNKEALYDFDLMLGGGHIAGWLVEENELDSSLQALNKLADPALFKNKYNTKENHGVLLFAMGDGNHSLATAKVVWENHKKDLPADHPLRYALVEIVNLYSEALVFEPIHRVIFGLKKDIMMSAKEYWPELIIEQVADKIAMEKIIKENTGKQKCGFVSQEGFFVWTFINPTSQLTVGTLQPFLDEFIKVGAEKIDYIHGTEEICSMGKIADNCGFFLPSMSKNDLFRTVIFDGALPRKTFSMGEAHEKRYYLECRKIL